jgi:hypothetical protein
MLYLSVRSLKLEMYSIQKKANNGSLLQHDVCNFVTVQVTTTFIPCLMYISNNSIISLCWGTPILLNVSHTQQNVAVVTLQIRNNAFLILEKK